MTSVIRVCTLALAGAVPVLAHAATTIPGIIVGLTETLTPLVGVALGVAVLVFVWGLALYIWGAHDDQGMESGRQRMLWGVIALFMIVSVWGVVLLLRTMVGVGAVNSCPPPQIGENEVTDCF